ncbi:MULTISPECIES: porin family protein [unclassified Prevotella]|uniref:porin family protein n=1 Tax=unclassified Prevotella TaxID=2638335 RepID=UPI000B9785D5|nr:MULTISPECIES: porin family protein [unclassified Prevotella]OYP70332.1 hypothetical protein CIK87_03090 [Prevotella sp. P5-64]OYP70750.1 hypothetical protein CIK92_09730 [Prevotella sp. P4-67]
MKKLYLILSLAMMPFLSVMSQIGEHRNDFTLGVNGGYILSNVSFTPKVTQGYHGGLTGGLSMRYVCEKYFKTIASVYAEVNYSQLGWKEDILDINNQAVINPVTGLAENYSRTINYVQVPILAHLAWGKEYKGVSFFVNLGPQFGFYLSEKTKSNFNVKDCNMNDRVSTVVAQDTMAVENKFDYGIAVGAGMEYTVPKVGHFLIEARYYYGLGNIYGDSKRDYFGSSNFGNIIIKAAYLFDITKTKK